MAKSGEFDVLITREMDRLARNLAKQLVYEDMFQSSNVRIEYALAHYDDTLEGTTQQANSRCYS